MFNNIIYFIIVLLIFNVGYQKNAPEDSLAYTLVMLFLTWLVFAALCKWSFQGLFNRTKADKESDVSQTVEYHKLVLRLSVLAISLFTLDIFLFDLRYWLQVIPGFKHFSVLQGTLAITVFISYLITIWYFSYPAYVVAFEAKIPRRSLVISNLRLNMPILFPWVILSFIFDLISFSPWAGPEGFLNEPEGQLIFFGGFLIILMIFMPHLIQYWWGCRPYRSSEKVRLLEDFLREKGFKYRGLLKWPIFESRMTTAGIMGVVPRYRYILVTDALMEILSTEELKAVIAHEMGHAKYRHMLFYVLFILGYVFALPGFVDLYDAFFAFLATQPFFVNLLESGKSETVDRVYLALLLIALVTAILIYFRYVMGFFMRHFERQADLYSAVTMGSPRPTISSLEKIALLSGKIRDLPSWHHFSIKERVDYLWRVMSDPRLVKRHNQFVAFAFGIYLIIMGGGGYLLNFSPAKESLTYRLVEKAVHQQLLSDPKNLSLYQNLAMIYHKVEKYREAIKTYEQLIRLDDNQGVAMNNLAWLLVTVPDESLRNEQRGLDLAKRAVALDRSSMFLDTLAEAYYANGMVPEAVTTIKDAISLAKEGKEYYEKQLRRFAGKMDRELE